MRISNFIAALALSALPVVAPIQQATAQQASAQQANGLTIKADTFVAKMVKNAQGKEEATLLPALRVVPGDALVLSYTYSNTGTKPVSDFVIRNKVPGPVLFTRIPDSVGVVSVDGGKTFGALATLKVKAADGRLRPALPSDVTDVQWKLVRPVAPGAKGNVMYYGVVK
jgi:hypothetical protein